MANPKSIFTEGEPVAAVDVQRAKFEYTKEQAALALDNERWKNRRRMSWLALWGIMLVTVAMFFWVPETRIEKLEEVVVWFYFSMASIISVYIGSATFSDIKSMVGRKNSAAIDRERSTPYDVYDQADDIADDYAADEGRNR